MPGLDAAGPLTNIEALELDYVPQHLIVLGGGYVGLEMAQAYRRFGSRVTIIEHGPQLAGREDPDVADEMRRILSAEGIDVLVATETRRVQGRSGGDVSLLVRTSSGEHIEGSDILVAAGRSPNTRGGTFEKREPSPSAMVGCARTAVAQVRIWQAGQDSHLHHGHDLAGCRSSRPNFKPKAPSRSSIRGTT